METLTLQSNKSNFYSTILRVTFGVIGIFYLVQSATEYFSTYEFTTGIVLFGILGIAILAVVIFNPTFGANIELILNDNFMRITEDLSFIRTAYWNKVDKLTLTRFSIRIRYQSGAPERFRLPFLSNTEHEEVRDWMEEISERHEINFTEKAWWKLF